MPVAAPQTFEPTLARTHEWFNRARKTGPNRRSPPGLADRLHRLTILSHRRWSIPILAELRRGDSHPGGAKFITLLNRLGISRDSLAATLGYLIHHDLVMRNPGYGHPMRPEYLLAEAGYDIAPACMRLMKTLHRQKLNTIASKKWSLPVIASLRDDIDRFSQLKQVLPGITPRALTKSLKDLIETGVVHRRIADSYPPASSYRLTAKGRQIASVLKRL